MDHKSPVSGSGDGVLLLDILMKSAKCTGCKYWQESPSGEILNLIDKNHYLGYKSKETILVPLFHLT